MELELTRDQVIELLTEIGAILDEQGLQASITIVGGAAIALTLDTRRTTKDIDAAFTDHSAEFLAAANIVGQRHNLPPGWINSGGAAFMSDHPIGEPVEMSFPGLQVTNASPEHLLAMKLRRSEARDYDDLLALCEHLGVTTAAEMVEIVEAQFDDSNLFVIDSDEYLYLAEDVVAYAEREGRPLGAKHSTSTGDLLDFPPAGVDPGTSGDAILVQSHARSGSNGVKQHWRTPPQK